MSNSNKIIFIFFIFSTITFCAYAESRLNQNANFVTYVLNPKEKNLKFYLKNNNNQNFGSIQNLKNELQKQNQELVFATNGGMYNNYYQPIGLFVENEDLKTNIDRGSPNGNFYLKPNGVFYINTSNEAIISKTEDFVYSNAIKYATQSGPMLVIDSKIHSAIKQGSVSVNIRNGVGILPNNDVIFVMSKTKINFYDFANYFKKLGCKNALFLDGFVSRTYLPEKNWQQTDGNFGVIIAVTK
jgi:uncharacterized protein YigE (DUF2233 family)